MRTGPPGEKLTEATGRIRLAMGALHEDSVDTEASGTARGDDLPVRMIAIAGEPSVASSRSTPRRQPVPMEIMAGLWLP